MTLKSVREAVLEAAAEISGAGGEGRILALEQDEDGGWRADVEAIEDNELIKALNLPTRAPVKDRNVYTIRLNRNLELVKFTKLPHRDWLAMQV